MFKVQDLASWAQFRFRSPGGAFGHDAKGGHTNDPQCCMMCLVFRAVWNIPDAMR